MTAPGVFDRTYDTALPPGASDDQRKAAITQLFYVTNFFHDWYYDAGFNEAAGNGQASNYGRGGVEGDAMRAEAQDYSGRDNANTSTPSDGGSPRMQMFVWSIGSERVVSVDAPAAAAAVFDAGIAAFGPGAFTLSGPVAVVDDGTGTPSDACEPLANASSMTGKIALVDRGTCSFVVKVANAQAAGAAGVVVVNNQGDVTITMGEPVGGTALPYTIPALFVGQSDGATLKSLVGAGLVVTLRRERDRDGTIDDQIVAHEWAHFLSNRLVGNANGLSANQAGRPRRGLERLQRAPFHGAARRRGPAGQRGLRRDLPPHGLFGRRHRLEGRPEPGVVLRAPALSVLDGHDQESADVRARHERRRAPGGPGRQRGVVRRDGARRFGQLRSPQHRRGVGDDALGVLRGPPPGHRRGSRSIRPGTACGPTSWRRSSSRP